MLKYILNGMEITHNEWPFNKIIVVKIWNKINMQVCARNTMLNIQTRWMRLSVLLYYCAIVPDQKQDLKPIRHGEDIELVFLFRVKKNFSLILSNKIGKFCFLFQLQKVY